MTGRDPLAESAKPLPDEAIGLAARALAHWRNKTTDQAPTPLELPVETYSDPARYQREVQRIFRELPIAVALSAELPEPGAYKSQVLMGTPLLITRDADGVAHVFLNVCRHRGAIVCAPGSGRRTRFSCPYHAWTYDNQGQLVGVYGEDVFGCFDRDSRGLARLECAERAGLIWACLTPGCAFDVDAWLGDFAARLDTLRLGEQLVYEQRDLDGPGWKATLDGYLEVYHHDAVHRSTVGRHTIGNLLVHDVFGPHQRLTFGRRNLPDLASVPKSDWQPHNHIRIIHSVFPNLSISGIVGGHCLVSQVFPGPTLDTTITRQTVLCASGEQTAEWRAEAQNFSEMTLQAVRDEDYAVVATIQAALPAGANRDFIIGRNEPGVQHYHRTVERFMQDAGSALPKPGPEAFDGGSA